VPSEAGNDRLKGVIAVFLAPFKAVQDSALFMGGECAGIVRGIHVCESVLAEPLIGGSGLPKEGVSALTLLRSCFMRDFAEICV